MKTLPEILAKSYRYFNQLSVWNLEDRIPVALEADIAAIAKELMGCLPENVNIQELMSANIEVEHEVYNIEFSKGFNKALDEVRARLTAFIGHKEK